MRKPRRLLIAGALVAFLAFLGYAFFWPCWIKPIAWTPDPDPGFTGPYAPNTALAHVERLAQGFIGPEDVELGPDGWLYATLRDGRIIRFDPQHPDSVDVLTHTHGFPLGLEFDRNGQLIVADGDRGLLSITPQGDISVLLDGIDGARFRFADDLAIASDGVIWFSDAYAQGPADMQLQAWEGIPTGRLLSYDPGTKRVQVRVDGLMYANGVTLGPDEACVLINELFGARVVRYWLKGPRRGSYDVFLPALPGYPDNIAFDGRDLFWIALVSPRTPAFERWSGYPIVRQFVAKAPFLRAPHPVPSLRNHHYMAWVVGVDTTGTVRYNLQSSTGSYGAITSANAYGESLYLGSIRMDHIGRLSLASLQPVR